jgi:hypothetical protein
MCTIFATLFLPLLPSHWYQPPLQGSTCSTLLLSDFVKDKIWHFCLFKLATQFLVAPLCIYAL